jgi:hypothetical protein
MGQKKKEFYSGYLLKGATLGKQKAASGGIT